MKDIIDEEKIKGIIRSNMRNASEEQVQHLTQKILVDALPAVCMLVRREIIEERKNMLKHATQCNSN